METHLTFWAKSGNPYHPLLGHMLDTAAVALEVLAREPASTRRLYAEDLGLPEEEALRWSAFFAGLHDLGKATPVFQMVWPEGAKRVQEAGLSWDGWAEERGNWVAHGVMTQVLLEKELGLSLSRKTRRHLARALGAHHGFVAQGDETERAYAHLRHEQGPWREARAKLVDASREALGLGEYPSRELSPAAVLRQMALASFSDWVASDPDRFSYGRDLSDPARYFSEARTLAQKALNKLGWHSRKPLAESLPDFRKAFPHLRDGPNALQEAVKRLVEGLDAGNPALLLVEAPMGGGKTEAALYAHLALQRANGHRGLYVALPTQATGNGLFPRVKQFLERFAGETPLDLQLQHGASVLNPEYVALKPRQVYEGEDGETGGVVASEWFSAKKRAMLSAYGVGTLDQALLGVLTVKHHFIRLWGLMNRTVVLDEVHAYDTYTSGLLKALLRWLRELGSSVVLMTATLPPSRRRELLEAYLGQGQIPELPGYPRVALFHQGRVETKSVCWPEKRYQLQKAPVKVEDLASKVRQSLPGVLGVVVNTVDRAQALYRAFGEAKERIQDEQGFVLGKRLSDGTEVYLLHARFPAEERQRREKAILKRFGKEGPRPEKAILVATQVVEQSLDLDFDALFTDLAPVDLVLQRAGRLHRHDRERPERHREPVLYIAGLDEPSFHEREGEKLFWNRVYEEYVLFGSFLALKERAEVRVPTDLEALLSSVYERGPEVFPERLKQRAEQAYQGMVERLKKEEETAKNLGLFDTSALVERGKGGEDLARSLRLDDEVEDERTQRLLTRLGDPSVAVVPVFRRGDRVYLDWEGREEARLKGELSPEEVRRLWARSVRLSRYPIPHSLLKEEPPPAWKRHGLLRNLRPLEVGHFFAEGKGRGVSVELDPELGLVYV